MELTVPDLFGLLLRSRLMPIDDARAMYQRWLQEAGDAAMELEAFARWISDQQFLTAYQVNLLRKGHAEGFFLQHYKILERLGKGRMAGVYKAVHDLGQIVALKVLPPSRARDPYLLNRFRREARLAMRLTHPHVVRAFQTGESDGLHYLVMEYLEGDNLATVLDRRGRFPPAEAARLVYQALLGLQHIHEQGLVHRDLKPANLMLVPSPAGGDTSACTLKILDIGLGRALLEEAGSDQMDEAPLTSAGVFLGTPDYIAPEQARDARTADIRSDIYSLGCVLYHLLAGQPVFPDTNLINQLVRHATESPKPLTEFNAEISEELQQITSAMLAKEPSARYQTPERAARALLAFLVAIDARPQDAEDSIILQSYVKWLETEDHAIDAPPAVEPSAPGEAGRKTPIPPAAETVPEPKRRKSGSKGKEHAERRRRSRKHRVKPPPLPVSDPLFPERPSPLQEKAAEPKKKEKIDVELVTSSPPEPEPPAEPFSLTWRDLLMFGGGVIGTLLSIFLARFLVSLLP